MSSFYTSNLIDNFGSSLISSEKDLKKVEDVEKNEVNAAGNEAVDLRKVQYPHKTKIQLSHDLIFTVPLLLVFYLLCKMSPSDGRLDNKGNIIPSKFLDPCNATNAMSLYDMEMIRNKIKAINDEKHSINVVVGYNLSMSPSATEYLSHKLTSLTQASNMLTKQIEEQKEIRFPCYKKNLEKRCEEKSFSKQIANGLHVYLIAVTILTIYSLYYIFKARKCELSSEQKKACNQAYKFSLVVVFSHVFFLIVTIVISFYDSCNIENDLKKFTL